MKRYVLLSLLLLDLALPAYAASVQKPQRQTWYERALNHVNPENKDFGAVWEERKRAFVIQLGNPYLQYGLCVTGALILLLTIAVAEYTSHRREMVVTAQSLADVLRHDHYSREVANEAIRRYNAHIESCNQAIESGAAAASSPDPTTTSELNRMNAVLLATRNESKALREDSEKKSRLIAELSVQLKKAKPLSTQIPLDFAPSDFITRINELEMQLSAEKKRTNVRRELLLMRIGLEGFGSIWSLRTKSSSARSAYYNTTGLLIDGRLRHRSRIYGDVRFNEIGGFNSRQIERNLGRVFESDNQAEPEQRSLLLHHISSLPAFPDYFLFAVTSDRTGQLPIDCDGWKSDAVTLISLSQENNRQEALLLMPAHSWIRGTLGQFVVEPRTDRSWRAFLQLRG